LLKISSLQGCKWQLIKVSVNATAKFYSQIPKHGKNVIFDEVYLNFKAKKQYVTFCMPMRGYSSR